MAGADPKASAGAATSGPPRRRLHPLRWVGAAVLVLLAAIGVFIAVFQWNWLRGPLADYASGRLHRKVTIAGDLSGDVWTWTPWMTARDISIAEPAWAGAGPMAVLPSLTVSIDLKALFGGKLVIVLIDAERPRLTLLRQASGRENWNFAPPGKSPGPLKLPPIRRFRLVDGRVTLDDARRRLRFFGEVSSTERTTGGGRGHFSLTGHGSLNGAPFSAWVTGGPLIDVDPNRPYDFAADIRAGAMRASVRGRVPHPFNFGQVEAEGRITGEDLANLYYLTGLTLPNTPPYDVSGRVTRNGERFAIDIARGRIGSSDIAGRLAVATVGGRRKLTGDLASHRLNLADLTATLGGAPKGVLKRTVASPRQQAIAARMTAAHRVLPDARLEVPRIRNMDADVRYRAGSVEAGPLPIRALALHVILDRGLLVIDPLAATLPLGSLAGRVSLDARGAEPVTTIDLSLANAEVQELLPAKLKGPTPFAGPLAASARLRGVGDSVRKAAASANGVVAVAIPHGQMRQLFAELLGIDVGKSLFLYLSKDEKPTPIRCGVAIFRAKNGVLVAQTLVLDTGAVLAQGKGYIDLRNETLNLQVSGKPKHLRLLRVAAPITLTGRLDAPKPGVEIAKALPQAGIGAALGALVSPLAALLPFISTGGAKNANCPALLGQARADGVPVAPAAAGH